MHTPPPPWMTSSPLFQPATSQHLNYDKETVLEWWGAVVIRWVIF
jgi:hypothetical protein